MLTLCPAAEEGDVYTPAVQLIIPNWHISVRTHCTSSSPANRSHRITNQRSKILLGHKNFYEPLCEKCYENASRK